MKKQIAIALLLILTSFTLGCLEPNDITPKKKDLIGATYRVCITPNGNGDYYVLIPIPLKNQTVPFGINDAGYFLLGNGSYNIIETKYGWAFNISSNEKIAISFDWISWNPVPDFSLSLNESIDDHQFYYLFSKKSGGVNQIKINITWKYQPYEDSPELNIRMQSIITNDGWSLLEAIDVSQQYIV